jgi:D-3-phosphoglycerate dehydrogenase
MSHENDVKKPLVVVAGRIHPAGIEILETQARVVVAEESFEAVVSHAEDAEAILVRSRPALDEPLMAACPRLKCVARYGVGVDSVDLEAATRLGLPVLYAPGQNSDAVAEHTLMLMLAVAKGLRCLDAGVRRGEWGAIRKSSGILELRGMVAGIIGVGNIGRRVARLAATFGMDVLGYDPYLSAEELERRGARKVDLPALLRASDLVTLHCPLTSETRQIINRKSLAQMKTGAILINTARGPVVDLAALRDVLTEGRLMGAGLDVFDPEPPGANHPLYGLDQVVLTPHLAGLSERAYRAMATFVTTEILKVLRGEPPSAVANPEVLAKPSSG